MPGDEDEGAGQGLRGRLTYQELLNRQQQKKAAKQEARKAGSALAAVDPAQGVAALAAAEEMGDRFQYAINQKVSLPRQKSALLPVVNADVEARKVSIFKESIDAKHPVLGVKFKNTSGHPLVQGPITVYEDGNYAGDARILDLQPKEERLIGYAVDLGTEVKAEQKSQPQQLKGARIWKGTLSMTQRLQKSATYLIKNRSLHDRVLLIEHPISPNWKLIKPDKPLERSRDDYRFQLSLASSQTAHLDVVEEMIRDELVGVNSAEDRQVQLLLKSGVVSPAVKEALRKAGELKGLVDAASKELDRSKAERGDIDKDQARLRENLKIVPQTSAAYRRYLAKFDTQETQIEKLQEQIKQLEARVSQQQKQYERYVAGLTVE